MVDEYRYPNEVERIYEDIEFVGEELDDFASVILVDPAISKNGKIDFAERFLIRYLTDDIFKHATDGCVFLFAGREYIGIYWNDCEAIKAAKELGYKGYETHLVPMYFNVYGEKRETTVISKGKIIRTTDLNGRVFETLVHEHLKVDGGLITETMEDYLEDLIKDKYILDTGAIITGLPNTKYFNYENKKYNIYPYNSNNEIIIIEEYRNDNLKIVGDSILHNKIIEMNGSLDNKYFKTELFFDNGFEFRINSIVRVKLNSLTVSYVDSKIFGRKTMFDYINNSKFIRPEESSKLLGLDILSQTKFISESVFTNVLAMKIVEKNEINNEILIDNNEYVVYLLKSDTELFESQIKIRIDKFGNMTDTENELNKNENFLIIKEAFQLVDSEDLCYHRVYNNDRPLNLIILMNIANKKILKNKINNCKDIDGWITENGVNYEIWIKNPKILKFKEEIRIKENSIDDDTYYFNYKPKKAYKISKNKLSSWNIKF